MIFGLLILVVALTLSTVAAFYSITGLTAIFPGAVIPIIVMGAALEVSKIVSTVWLHKYWNRVAVQFKLYLIPAIVILMLITSMGIFGLLSKSHLDQAVTSGDVSSQVQIFDDKIKTEKDNIEAARKALKQMDSQVDERLSRSSDDKGAERAVQIRRSQQKERTNLQNEITTTQKKITALQEQRAPIASQERKIEADVGPIRYIAALLYGENPDANLLEKAVRLIIILIVLVFDPLALVLILAADQTFAWHREDKKKRQGWSQVWQPDTEAWPEWDDKPKATEDFDPRPEPAYELDDGPLTQATINNIQELANEQLDVPVLENEETLAQQAIETPASVVVDIPYADPPPLRGRPAPATDEEPINPVPKAVVINESPSQIVIPDFSIGAEQTNPVNAGFGTQFPINPVRGDMFLRVDYLPSKLYKWNDKKWIEVDKERTDSFAYNERYIKHLIDKIDSGEYDVDILSAAEQEQISRYLNNGRTTT